MLRALYVANATLLIVHEIDSAFWREWDLFGLPGGEPGFLAIHVVLAALVIWGYGRLVEGARAGAVMSLALALASLAAAAIHAAFLMAGRPEFRAAFSIAVLASGFAVSALQAPLALRALRGRGTRAPLRL